VSTQLSQVKKIQPKRQQMLLDAAEDLFSKHGFDGVTVRQIANLAGVDVALPNYYFGSKRGLFDAVFLRRAKVFNQARSDALDVVLTKYKDKKAPVEDIVDAFLQPIAQIQESNDPGWRNYCQLVALVNNSSVWVGMMTSHYDELIHKFISVLQLALPEASEKDLYWAYQFLSGALTLTMANTGRIDHLSNGLCHSDDFEEAYSHMVKFFSDGFRHMATTAPAKDAEPA
jgi:AcrR family transcriptional regulator